MSYFEWTVRTQEGETELVGPYAPSRSFTLADPEDGGAGSVRADGSLEGAGSSPNAGAGDVAAEGELDGTGLSVRTASGEVVAQGRLEGDGLQPDDAVEAAGSVHAEGRLEGAGRANKAASGQIAADGTLEGMGVSLDPPNLQAQLLGDDVLLTWDASVLA